MANVEYAREYALKHQARVHEAKKDLDRARAVYQEMTKLDPTSPLKAFADERLRLLE